MEDKIPWVMHPFIVREFTDVVNSMVNRAMAEFYLINRVVKLVKSITDLSLTFKVSKQWYMPSNPAFFHAFYLVRAYRRIWWRFKAKVFAMKILEDGRISLRIKDRKYEELAIKLGNTIGNIEKTSYGGWDESAFDLDVHSTIYET